MWKKTCRGPPPYLAIYHNGLFQKKSKQGTGGGGGGGGGGEGGREVEDILF